MILTLVIFECFSMHLSISSLLMILCLYGALVGGVCGSDAMNINGKNGLACITKIEDLKEPVVLRPLPGLPVIRDLVVDMSQFFKQFHSVKPYLNSSTPAPDKKEFKHLRIET